MIEVLMRPDNSPNLSQILSVFTQDGSVVLIEAYTASAVLDSRNEGLGAVLPVFTHAQIKYDGVVLGIQAGMFDEVPVRHDIKSVKARHKRLYKGQS